ncbi:SUMF1/EgtB/PvdO family nonheme iron enzyme [Nostoc sp. KVJ3]|uniref:SAV_2336 N-terminal domain-related protein n=1 Tax=Nostoc sp. KVJ3 TaxID=457945 RepID=UPI002238F30E|nr:SAV_2336 N-terminal domain-related protein [Nostoc sp. KVJ3]MCW5318359.1 SUMF1/EgtB/PvdO family nonheme iron enzyme [Nostoc sp. KVJ3]
MIERVIGAFQNLGFDLTDTEIADILWLAVQMRRSNCSSVSEPEQQTPVSTTSKIASTLPQLPLEQNLNSSKSINKTEASANVYPQSSQDSDRNSSGIPIKVPAAQALRNQLEIGRALRPLKRRVPSKREFVLDEAATAERIAKEKLLLPVMKSAPERWLELALVVDEGASMMLWTQTIKELRQLLERHGAFRDVRTWGLFTDKGDKVWLRPRIGSGLSQKRLHNPRELIDPNGRRLFVVISDCVSPAWRSSLIIKVLAAWAYSSPTAIIQVLPNWLWERSALGFAESILLRSSSPGVPNEQLVMTALDLLDESDNCNKLKIPVVTLESESVKNWARMVAGWGDVQTKGFLLATHSDIDVNSELTENLRNELSANQLLQRFRLTASPVARKLAGLLAATPISFPIVRLIQQTMLPQSNQVHVAEVFLGGILKPLPPVHEGVEADNVQFDFIDGVRDLLLDGVPLTESTEVLRKVSEYVAQRVGLSVDEFTAMLSNQEMVFDASMTILLRPFAQITSLVLRRLGGEYVKLADSLQANIQSESLTTAFEGNCHFLWQQGNTKIYSVCTDNPWNLPFDALVISVTPTIRLDGGLARSLEKFLKDDFLLLRDAIDNALLESKRKAISSDRPLLVSLPDKINRRFAQTKNHESKHFIICATIESFRISLANIVQATEAIINLSVEMQLGRLVITLLGTGDYGLSSSEVATKMLSEINRTLSNFTSTSLKEIIFVDKQASIIATINNIANYLFHVNNINTELIEIESIVENKIDNIGLQDLLAREKWREADEETFRLLLKATNREREGTLDYQAINNIPCTDLDAINRLWINASKGRFGFSVQLKKWQELGGRSNKNLEYDFGNSIGWYLNNEWLSDSSKFTYNLSAPAGHLPVEWTFHLGGIFPRREKPALFADMADRLLSCNINNLETETLFDQSDSEISLQNFAFITITVNHKGEIIKTETKTAQYFTEGLPNDIPLQLVAIPGGTFMMGSPEGEGEDNEHPQHEVNIEPFLMSKHQITQVQWEAIAKLPEINCQLRSNPSRFKGNQHPVEQVNREEAIEFCARLSKKTGRLYRLPSEAEWEYACRARTTTPFYFGEVITSELANYDARITINNSPTIDDAKKIQYRQQTMPVGSFLPNSFGLYDMHGNVWEWCADNWHKNYVGAPSNGCVWLSNDIDQRWVLRGGSWNVSAGFCRSAFRNWDIFSEYARNFGFRIVCDLISFSTQIESEQPIYEPVYELWGETSYGELISVQDNLSSEQGINYTHLRDLLAAGSLSEADDETLMLMLRAAKREEEGWLNAESIKNFPCTDLQTIDQLWVKYSNGRFGFSVQKQIWESMGAAPNADDEKWLGFGKRVGWRGSHGAWQEYKNITFSQNAPLGHLPLAKLGGGRWTNDQAAQRRIIWGSFIKWIPSLAVRLVECSL